MRCEWVVLPHVTIASSYSSKSVKSNVTCIRASSSAGNKSSILLSHLIAECLRLKQETESPCPVHCLAVWGEWSMLWHKLMKNFFPCFFANGMFCSPVVLSFVESRLVLNLLICMKNENTWWMQLSFVCIL